MLRNDLSNIYIFNSSSLSMQTERLRLIMEYNGKQLSIMNKMLKQLHTWCKAWIWTDLVRNQDCFSAEQFFCQTAKFQHEIKLDPVNSCSPRQQTIIRLFINFWLSVSCKFFLFFFFLLKISEFLGKKFPRGQCYSCKVKSQGYSIGVHVHDLKILHTVMTMFLDRQIWANTALRNSLVRVCTVCHSVCISTTHLLILYAWETLFKF